VTLNVNSLHAAIRDRGLIKFIDRTRADTYAFQETMTKEDNTKWRIAATLKLLKTWGYHVYWHPGARNNGGYGGTMFVTRHEAEHVLKGTGNKQVDSEGRFLALVYPDRIVVNTYAPTLGLDLTGQNRKTLFGLGQRDDTMRSNNSSRAEPRYGSET
jgi:exonuclease III